MGRLPSARTTPDEVISYVEHLGLLHRDEEEFGAVLGHDPFTAVLMTWYRNNVVHTLALPSLVACLLVKRRRSVGRGRLREMVHGVYPYLAQELSCTPDLDDFEFDDDYVPDEQERVRRGDGEREVGHGGG